MIRPSGRDKSLCCYFFAIHGACDTRAVRNAFFAIAAAGCVTSLHIVSTASLSVGSIAPPFALPSQDGHTVTLADELARGPVALVFYRGYW